MCQFEGVGRASNWLKTHEVSSKEGGRHPTLAENTRDAFLRGRRQVSHWLKMAKGSSLAAGASGEGALVAGLGDSTLASGAMFFDSGTLILVPGVTAGSCWGSSGLPASPVLSAGAGLVSVPGAARHEEESHFQ